MKTLFTLLSLFFSCYALQSEAQIFKKLGEKIERSVEKRIEKRADKPEDKAPQEAEESTERAVNEAVTPTEVAEQSPAAIGSLPADFQLEVTGSGPDTYMEYRVDVTGEGLDGNQMEMFMKIYTSPSKGGGRAETIMKMPVVGEIKMVSLTDFDTPLRMTILNERKKEYSILDLREANESESDDEYTVTRLGEEELHGMNCVRSRAVTKDGAAFEIWTTTEIPGYEEIAAVYSKMQKMGSAGLWNELQQAGAAGFMVKLETQIEGGSSVMQLVKMENTTVPESLLRVPADYEKKEGGWAKQYLKSM